MTLNFNQNILIAIAIISLTLVGIIALTRNTETEIDIYLGGDNSVKIKARSPSTPEKTNDCLPGGESSQSLNCNNH